MRRDNYKIFSEGKISYLTLCNRLIRSATWDPSILKNKQISDEVLDLYRNLALGGVGLIISGGFPVFQEQVKMSDSPKWLIEYRDLRVNGIEQMPLIVHNSSHKCKIIAQVENGNLSARPSVISSPFSRRKVRQLTIDEIDDIVNCFVKALIDMKNSGVDGVQIHAAPGGLLSRFLSPFTNRREDG